MPSQIQTPEDKKNLPAAQPPEEFTGIHLGHPSHAAAGLPAVLSSMNHVMGQAGLLRGTQAMLAINQKDGFDCPSCAWPDPDDHRAKTEFCENGAKAIAAEATKARATPEFFRRHTVRELAAESDYWLEQQGRLVEPMLLEAGAERYRAIEWDEAFRIIAEELNALPTADDAIFYTSGRASNEAAFAYQLFVRQFGTNNLPDCSNMCHESSGAALKASVGIGKGSVTLRDIETAETIIVAGQNPGTNHPRMLSSLQLAVRHGAKVIAVNPLKEPGLLGFKHPQEVSGMLGISTPLSSQYLQVKLNGDMALFRGIAKALLQMEDERPGRVLDRKFLDEKTAGSAEYLQAVRSTSWEQIVEYSGIAQDEITRLAEQAASGEKKLITCWAMGLTQHKNAVATIQEITQVHLLLGAVGRPGAGLCPVRGHSNVQGDRTMGIFEKMADSFHDRLDEVFQFKSPRKHGYDVVAAIKAMHAEAGKVFIALGGNFLSATPDTEFTATALRQCRLTVHIATKLNRSHLIHGRRALILPCLGRTEVDVQRGQEQFVTVEDSMGVVHKSQGTLRPAGDQLRSETAIICGMAAATLAGRSAVPWLEWSANYDLVRDKIEAVIPGFENFNRRVREPGGFYLPNCAREGWFDTPSGKAEFFARPLTVRQTAPGRLLLQTLRSHDQFNTTIYGLNDRYRGIGNERRVVFLNPEDMRERGIRPVKPVNLVGHWKGEERRANGFLAIPYDTPRGTAAAYFPEANVLVPIDSVADESLTPTSKAVEISLELVDGGVEA
jgi:molybdopterin-dependent oxidoreductase alpha subunit